MGQERPVGNIQQLTTEPAQASSAAWGLSDILGLPEPQAATQTQVFAAGGKEWPITIRTDARTSAEHFYDLTLCLSRAIEDKSLSFLTPAPNPRRIEIKSAAYLGQLYILEKVAVSPSLSAEEWAIFGHKVGGLVMEKILDWATTESGISEYLLDLQLRHAKNGLSAEDSSKPSSAPASKSVKTSRKSR